MEGKEQNNPYNLDEGSTYFECQIEQIENMVSFEGDDRYGFSNYQCSKYEKEKALEELTKVYNK